VQWLVKAVQANHQFRKSVLRRRNGWSRRDARLTRLLHPAFQLDQPGAAKNQHRDLEPGARVIGLLNNPIKGREGTIRDTDLLTYLELTYLEEN
jgi:hypothetical protein